MVVVFAVMQKYDKLTLNLRYDHMHIIYNTSIYYYVEAVFRYQPNAYSTLLPPYGG